SSMKWTSSDRSSRRVAEPGRRTRNQPTTGADPMNSSPSSAADQLFVTSNCKNLFSRSMVKAIPALSKMASRARYRTPINSGPLTERDRLAAATRAAGLRLTAADLEALRPAWKRYLALVEELRAALAPEPSND